MTAEREIAGECRDLRRRSDGLQCGGSESEVELGDRLRVEAEPCLVRVLQMLWEKRTIHPGDHCRFSPEQVKRFLFTEVGKIVQGAGLRVTA